MKKKNKIVFLQKIKSKIVIKQEGPIVEKPQDAVQFAHDILDSDLEHLILLYIGLGGKVVCYSDFEIGIVGELHFSVREIIKNAFLSNTIACIAIHNHPSGDLKPSADDLDAYVKLRDSLIEFGIKLWDFIIVTRTEFLSFEDHKDNIKKKIKEKEVKSNVNKTNTMSNMRSPMFLLSLPLRFLRSLRIGSRHRSTSKEEKS